MDHKPLACPSLAHQDSGPHKHTFSCVQLEAKLTNCKNQMIKYEDEESLTGLTRRGSPSSASKPTPQNSAN